MSCQVRPPGGPGDGGEEELPAKARGGHGPAAARAAVWGAGLPSEDELLTDGEGLSGLRALQGVAHALAAHRHGVPSGKEGPLRVRVYKSISLMSVTVIIRICQSELFAFNSLDRMSVHSIADVGGRVCGKPRFRPHHCAVAQW